MNRDTIINTIIEHFTYVYLKNVKDRDTYGKTRCILYFREDTNCIHVQLDDLYKAWKQYYNGKVIVTEFDMRDRLINHFGWNYDRGNNGLELKQPMVEYDDKVKEHGKCH